jgi:hypothetical protein
MSVPVDYPPTSCEMPDLADLPRRTGIMIAVRSFAEHGPKDARGSALWFNFVRLVEKAISDYQLARAAVLTYLDAPPDTFAVSDLMLATAHTETCVGSMHRAVRFGQRLRRMRSVAPAPVPQKPSVLSSTVERRLATIRNGVEHLDEDVLSPDRPLPQPAFLRVATRDVSLRGETITFEELAKWLRELHDVAAAVAGADKLGPPRERSAFRITFK